jgi:hypothetical protein
LVFHVKLFLPVGVLGEAMLGVISGSCGDMLCLVWALWDCVKLRRLGRVMELIVVVIVGFHPYK